MTMTMTMTIQVDIDMMEDADILAQAAMLREHRNRYI